MIHIETSVAEPHYFYAVSGKNWDAALNPQAYLFHSPSNSDQI
jgi:hypothetical protein